MTIEKKVQRLKKMRQQLIELNDEVDKLNSETGVRQTLNSDVLMSPDNIAQAKDSNWARFDEQWKHVHNWRTYVTDEVRANWDKIPLIGRCAIISCCEEMASNEEWD